MCLAARLRQQQIAGKLSAELLLKSGAVPDLSATVGCPCLAVLASLLGMTSTCASLSPEAGETSPE